MNLERLADTSSKFLVFIKDVWGFEDCDKCSKRGYCISCQLRPGSKIRLVRCSSNGELGESLVEEITLTLPERNCLARKIKDWGQDETLEKALKEEVEQLKIEFKKLTPNR